jgi:WD40 repeat protein
LSYHNNSIAVGSEPGDIIILNAITGSQTAVLSGHTDEVNCLTFSSDGTSLVSGSDDCTVKLWDVQTGGVVKTFSGHTDWVWSVSISADCTIIASGSSDNTICLWNIQTGECQHVIRQQEYCEAYQLLSHRP